MSWSSEPPTHLAGERDHVVLAQGEDVNVSHDDHLVVVFRKHRIVDHVNQPLLVPLSHPQQRLRIPLRRPLQTLSVRVFADAFENRPKRVRQDGQVVFSLLGRGVEAFDGVLSCRQVQSDLSDSPAHPKPSSSAIPPGPGCNDPCEGGAS